MMGVSLSGLTHRIKADKPQFHLAIYGLATYMGQNDGNLKLILLKSTMVNLL